MLQMRFNHPVSIFIIPIFAVISVYFTVSVKVASE